MMRRLELNGPKVKDRTVIGVKSSRAGLQLTHGKVTKPPIFVDKLWLSLASLYITRLPMVSHAFVLV